MKKIYNRHTANVISEYSFRMNNWKEAKFSSTQSSFDTKKSFNNIIKLNVNYNNADSKSSTQLGFNKYVTKDMKFYNKSYEELLQENLVKRFDSVTFKSLKHNSKQKTLK
jgi:hypothetical protein